ncbi:ATP-binding cassette domain-containing protein [Geitlerinema sp. PCC 9228]|uniref:ATP-binding cassette domain-containing protein n=1 Tax=Geitlerinema sp. PCC 9228 TaxID=111611 RepID=UPI0008F9AE78|nr:ATP-binding cassette domain-containing protein [Geitlerinema sp. PCC 9228]
MPQSARKNPFRSQFCLEIEFAVACEITVLFGSSGCGKSSTLKAIAGLLPPDSGKIVVGGQTLFDDRSGMDLPPHQRQIGYVFQEYALFPHMSVAQNIGFALHRWSKSRQRQRIEELAQMLEIQDLLTFSVQKLSGGQAQRVAIARALAAYPRMLLLDEPFSALNDELRSPLRKQLKNIQQKFQIPVILVTHSKAEAMEIGDSLIVLSQGKVVARGNPTHLLDNRSYDLMPDLGWG